MIPPAFADLLSELKKTEEKQRNAEDRTAE